MRAKIARALMKLALKLDNRTEYSAIVSHHIPQGWVPITHGGKGS